MDQSFWETLLVNIDAERVIPIVGPELLTVQDQGVEKPLHRYVAETIAVQRGIAVEDLSDMSPLNDLVWRCIEEKKIAREVIYKNIKDLATQATVAIPDSLIKLAQIRHFKLFVTTTFDSLLERAINQVRAPQKARVFTYTPSGSKDLPETPLAPNETAVYHLLGVSSPFPDDYVITDEDLLEFVYSLQDKMYRPARLFDALKAHNLLIIGSTFTDWLARFFIRGAKGERLSQHRERMFLADRFAGNDKNLVIFLERYTNNKTQIFDKGANEFVSELWERYSEAHANDQPQAVAAPEKENAPGTGPTIFLSYAHEDLAKARAITEFLTKIGWIVWFDKKDLMVGDNWDLKIKKALTTSDLFLPLISANTESQDRAYFRKEWKRAADEAEAVDETVPYLVPILIDQKVDIDKALVPAQFRVPQWYTLDEGQITQDFDDKMVQLLRDWHKRRQGRG